MGYSIVDICFIFANNGDDDVGFLDRQFPGYVFNLVVTSRFSDLCRTRFDLSWVFACICLLPVKRDACQCVASLQALYCYLNF